MKKVIIICLITIVTAVLLSSCGSSQKAGCKGTQGFVL